MFRRLSANHLLAKAGKYHLLTVSSNLSIDICINITKVSNEKRVKLIRVNFEGRRLNFDYHMNTLLKK